MPGGHRGRARAGQGEVEQDQVLGPVAAALPDAEVGGLDVPVVDPRPVQRDQRLEQVGAPPFQQVQGQPLAAAQHLAERLLAGALQHQGLPAAHVERALDQPHQPRVGQPGQHLGLVGDPARRRVVHRHLQHPDGVRAGLGHRQVRDQQADGGGPRAEAALQPEPAVDDRAGRGLQRVDHVLGRPGQGTFGVGQPLQEGPHVRQPLAHRGPGGLQHQRAHRRRHLRQVRRQVEPVVPVQPLAQRRAVGRGRAAGQHVVGQRAEREHVQPDPVGVAVPHALGGLERLGQPPVHVHRTGPHHRARLAAAVGRAHQAGDPAARQPGRRRARDRARAPPVTHQDPQLAVRPAGAPRPRAGSARGARPGSRARTPPPRRPAAAAGSCVSAETLPAWSASHRSSRWNRSSTGYTRPTPSSLSTMSRGRSSRSFASRDMIRYSCSATWRILARSVVVAPGGVTRNRIRPRSVVATRWNAGQSCQPSPSPSGSSSITHEPASRWRRWTIPIRFISAAMISSRLAPTRLLRRGRLEQPLGDPGQPGIALGAVQAEQVDPGRLRQQAAQARMVQEHGLLHERHDGARVGDRRRRSPGPSGSARPAACWPAAAPCAARASAGSPRPGDRPAARSGHRRAACPSSTSAPPGAGGAGPAPAGRPRATCRGRHGTRSSTTRGTGAFAGSRARTRLSPSASCVNWDGVTSIQR